MTHTQLVERLKSKLADAKARKDTGEYCPQLGTSWSHLPQAPRTTWWSVISNLEMRILKLENRAKGESE